MPHLHPIDVLMDPRDDVVKGRLTLVVLKLGAHHDEALCIAGNLRRWWHTSALGLNRLLTNAYFDSLGVPRFS